MSDETVVEVPLICVLPGTLLFVCNRCNKLRHRNVPICCCGCPEFGLMVMTVDGPKPDVEFDPPYSREARAKREEARR